MNSKLYKGMISVFVRNSTFSYSKFPSTYCISLFSSSTASNDFEDVLTPVTDVYGYLVNKHTFSLQAASKAASAVKVLKRPAKLDSLLSFLKESRFTMTHIENVVIGVPAILSSNLEKTIKPKIKMFQSLGFSSTEIANFLSRDPWILARSANNRLGPSLSLLRTALGTNENVRRVLKVSGWFLKHDLKKTMMLNIQYMESIGMCSSQIINHVFNFPRFFLLKLESIQEFVRRADELGADRKSRMFLPAVRVLSSMSLENWEMKVKLFRDLGFSQDEVLAIFRRLPQVFAVSERKIKKSTELLLGVGKHDISFMVSHPELYICSIEQRIKPRLGVIDILEKKNLLRKRPSLTTICKITHEKFRERYVIPYSAELEAEGTILELMRSCKHKKLVSAS